MVTYQNHHDQQEDDDLSSSSTTSSLPLPPRISFSSSELLDEEDFISINPKKPSTYNNNNNSEFEFFSSGKNVGGQNNTMSTADELFYDGKLLPFWRNQTCGVAGGIKTREVEVEAAEEEEEEIVAVKTEENKRVSGCNTSHPSWYLDEDPSPRPPKCTVLWKELLRLKNQRGFSSLSPSSSSSSASSSSCSMADVAATEDDRKETGFGNLREVYLQRIRKGLEKTRSGSMRIRPIVSVPVCTHVRTNSNGGGLPPLFPIRKGRSVQ